MLQPSAVALLNGDSASTRATTFRGTPTMPHAQYCTIPIRRASTAPGVRPSTTTTTTTTTTLLHSHSHSNHRSASTDAATAAVEAETAVASGKSTLEKNPLSDVEPELGVLWVSNIGPIKTSWWDLRYRFFNNDAIAREVAAMISAEPGIEVLNRVVRSRDGGVYLTVEAKPGFGGIEGMLERMRRRLENDPLRTPFSLEPVRLHRVLGIPWFEDLRGIHPSVHLRIEVDGPLANDRQLQERLFERLRHYGRLYDLSVSPTVAKDGLPRVAIARFQRRQGAIAARSCLHRAIVELNAPTPESEYERKGLSMMRISYEAVPGWIEPWIQKNPRLVVALVGFLLAIVSIAVFDPLRTFFCTAKITGRFAFKDYESVRWISDLGERATRFLRTNAASSLSARLGERQVEEEKLRLWVAQPPGSILYIRGAPGSGTSEFARKAREYQSANVLELKFARMLERGEDDFIKQFARSVGYVIDAKSWCCCWRCCCCCC